MDFFKGQDLARRNTRLLILLFVVACAGLILAANLFVSVFVFMGLPAGSTGWLDYFATRQFLFVAGAMIILIGIVILLRWVELSAGGAAVAEMLGGVRVPPNTDEPKLRQYQNVVAEIALAANMPVPGVYLLPRERGMNAFAAGIAPRDADICVTEGLLDHLQRDELQGVVGHEFSHILEGDMRLNIRLAAMLKGITFIGDIGRMLMWSGRRSYRSKERNPLPFIGLGLWLIGSLGVGVASLIQAAISRQREFHADASAVQFTRDSAAVADALKVVGGYLPSTHVQFPGARAFGHAFFGAVKPAVWSWASTHPPIEERIRRISPRWDGRYLERPMIHYTKETTGADTPKKARMAAALLAGSDASFLLAENMQPVCADIPLTDRDSPAASDESLRVLHDALVEPLVACAALVALFVSRDTEVRAKQFELVASSKLEGLVSELVKVECRVNAAPSNHRLPMVELACAAIRQLSYPQYQNYRLLLKALIRADSVIDLTEWVLFHLILHYVEPEFVRSPSRPPKYRRLHQAERQVVCVLSLLAHMGRGDPELAFTAAVEDLGLRDARLLTLADCSVADFSKAVDDLGLLFPLLKPRVLKAMSIAARCDDDMSPLETELIYAVAAVMDSPVPSLDAGGF
jgi:Zn-dependent protease with chaperone function